MGFLAIVVITLCNQKRANLHLEGKRVCKF